jgi:photosystem II stability/assembly factor-like uncharacterized protein
MILAAFVDFFAIIILVLPPIFVAIPVLAQTSRAQSAGARSESFTGDESPGDVYAIVVDPRKPSTLYVATNGRGIFKSTNAGESWKNLGSGIPPHAHFEQLVIDRLDPNTLYAAGVGAGVFKTSNGGDSWFPSISGLPRSLTYGLAIDPTNPSTLYVGADHRIFKTTDGGRNWRATSPELTKEQVDVLAVDPARPQIVYAVAPDGVFESSDEGVRWTPINSGLPHQGIEAISIDPARPSILYLGTSKNGIFKSTNGGKSWSPANSGLQDKARTIPPVSVLAIDLSNPKTLYAGVTMKTDSGPFAAVFKSTDSGKRWKLLRVLGAALGFSFVHCLAVDPSISATVYAGVDSDGLYKSVDGGENWSGDDSSLSMASVVALAIGRRDGTLYAGTLDGVFTFDGHNWRQIGFRYRDFRGEWVAYLAVDPSDSETIYVGTRSSDASVQGGVFKSTNGGRSWSLDDDGLRGRGLAVWISAFAIDQSAPSVLYAGTWGYGIFRSADGGKTWGAANSGLTGSERGIAALALDSGSPTTLFAVTSGSILKSTTQGRNWTSGTGLPATSKPAWRSRLTTVAINPVDGSVLYAAHFDILGGSAIYKSIDRGANWFEVGKLAKNAITCFAIDPANPEVLLAGNGDSGISKSTDGGVSWSPANSGLPSRTPNPALGSPSRTLITGLVTDPIHPGTLYISMEGMGVFESTDGAITWHPLPAR